jgi:molybdate transport repressor ModE-like protein
MNTISNTPLVIRTIGGTGGGGSEVTETGQKAIQLFNQIKASNKAHLEAQLEQIDFS